LAALRNDTRGANTKFKTIKALKHMELTMQKKFFYINILLCILLTAALTISCQKETPKQGGAAATTEKKLYICPMHPQVTADNPGDCSICGGSNTNSHTFRVSRHYCQ
ncbi:MAG: hypothetical protein NTX06_04730, partial [Proteobacteria bacterium]|nr:hypothetical protein [Pseudomonadota bacterium]